MSHKPLVLPIADGGTGSITAENARNAFGTPGILSSTTGISGTAIATTNLYTVPAGKTCIITRVQYRITAATALAGVMTAGVGIAAGESDIMASTNLLGFNTTGKTYGFSTSATYVIGTAGQVIKLGIDTAFGGGPVTIAIELIGYLI